MVREVMETLFMLVVFSLPASVLMGLVFGVAKKVLTASPPRRRPALPHATAPATT